MCPYSEEMIGKLCEHQISLKGQLQQLMLECIQQGQALPESLAREHMVRGAGRRLGVLIHSTESIFSLFPCQLPNLCAARLWLTFKFTSMLF